MRKTIKLNISCHTLDLYYLGLLSAPLIAYLFIGLVFGAEIEGWWPSTTLESTAGFILGITLITVSHEALHIVVLLFAGVKLKEISLTRDIKNLSIELSCKKEISIRAWRFSLAMPFLVLTPTLLFIAIFSESSSNYWSLLAISISGCAYDLALFRGLSELSSSQIVIPEGRSIDGYLFIDEIRNQT